MITPNILPDTLDLQQISEQSVLFISVIEDVLFTSMSKCTAVSQANHAVAQAAG